jgi:15-cis-phytoene synthase
VWGSAEVIGLFMAKLIGLEPQSYPYARMQGRAMQFINFIRDIDEDRLLGRRYLPLADSGLPGLDTHSAEAHPDLFARFMREQIGHYRRWQAQAETGYRFIPARYLVPIKTASDMYGWTADRIEADPFVVFDRKVKPARSRIVFQGLVNAIGGLYGSLRAGEPGHPRRTARALV